MRICFLSLIAIAASFAPAIAVAQPPSEAPNAKVDGPAPRAPDGKPDLSGIWERPYVPDMTKTNKAGTQIGMPELPYTEAGLKAWKSYDAAVGGDYTGSCLPFGLMRSMNSPDPIQIMQSPTYVAFLYEQNTWFHVIKLNKPHIDGVPTWFGDSIGHWDGDTLVVDTVNFNGRTRLDTIGHPHSTALHIIERFTRTSRNHIAYEVTIDDPKTFTHPWTNKRIFTLRPDWEIMEYSCEENNKDLYEGHIKPPPPPK